jgi:hypothetical protein
MSHSPSEVAMSLEFIARKAWRDAHSEEDYLARVRAANAADAASRVAHEARRQINRGA